MPRPSEFIAGSFLWSIEYYEHDAWPTHEHDATGLTFAQKHLIMIRKSDDEGVYSKAQMKVALFHELFHVAYHLSGLTFDSSNPEVKDQEEYTIRHLTNPFLTVLRENPGLASWLLVN